MSVGTGVEVGTRSVPIGMVKSVAGWKQEDADILGAVIDWKRDGIGSRGAYAVLNGKTFEYIIKNSTLRGLFFDRINSYLTGDFGYLRFLGWFWSPDEGVPDDILVVDPQITEWQFDLERIRESGDLAPIEKQALADRVADLLAKSPKRLMRQGDVFQIFSPVIPDLQTMREMVNGRMTSHGRVVVFDVDADEVGSGPRHFFKIV